MNEWVNGTRDLKKKKRLFGSRNWWVKWKRREENNF